VAEGGVPNDVKIRGRTFRFPASPCGIGRSCACKWHAIDCAGAGTSGRSGSQPRPASTRSQSQAFWGLSGRDLLHRVRQLVLPGPK